MSGKARRALSRLRGPLFSVAFALFLLGGTEVVLRLAGIGDPTDESRLEYQRVRTPLLRPAALADGTPVLRTVDPRLPVQTVLRDKPVDALRVVTFGGSATAGLGFSPNVTFARHLERMLRDALPGRTVEVLNLGIVALSSRQVKGLVADVCEHADPDIVVVYSGNNEFLEVHAEKYARSRGGMVVRAREVLRRTNLWRALEGLIIGGRTAEVADDELSTEALRLTQDQIIEDIEMRPDEIRAVVDDYEANLDAIARTAGTDGVSLVLMAVGSNWEWRGRSDLPPGWLEELAPDGRPESALAELDARLAAAPERERHEWLFRRAEAYARLGDMARARDDYRAAMNADPHLRRALDAMNERVHRVASRHGVIHLDTVEHLASLSDDGIVGFDEYYDYVHFTPRGVVVVAAEIFRRLAAAGLIEPREGFDPGEYVEARLGRELSEDPLDVGEWMGLGFDVARIHDRDLWKYEQALAELDERLAADPGDVRARVYRGNARFFRVGGREGAEEDYRAALAVDPGLDAARANLERLLAERPR